MALRAVLAVALLGTMYPMDTAVRHDACPRSLGYSEISADGTLTIHIQMSSGVEMREVHASGSPDYRSYLAWAGNPRVGERKPIPIYSGLASMSEDRVITFTVGSDNGQGLTVEPSTGRITPGRPDYQAMIDRVGGLAPGEFRGIPAEVDTRCGSMPAPRSAQPVH